MMRRRRGLRRGTSLVELLVALPLGLIAAATAAILLVRLARATRTQGAQLTAIRELRHALAVLRDDLEPLEVRDVVAVSDTLIEIRAHLGVLHFCEPAGATSMIVAAPERLDDAWVAGIRAGDAVRSWGGVADAGTVPVERLRTVVGGPVTIGRGACGIVPSVPTRRWRLTFADSQPQLAAGTPVLVQRGVRYQHYRSGGSWWLGRRTRDGVTWEGLQPVAGPLLSPSQGGMQAAALNEAATPAGLDSVAAVRVVLRTPRRVVAPVTIPADSATIEVALRASAYRRWRP